MIEENMEEIVIEIITKKMIEIIEENQKEKMKIMGIEKDKDQTEGKEEIILDLIQTIQADQVHLIIERAKIEKTKRIKEVLIMDLIIHLPTINSRQLNLKITIRMTSDHYCIIINAYHILINLQNIFVTILIFLTFNHFLYYLYS
jgi:hypothetical protein